jgi:C1A family cysteine protease
MSRFLPHGLGWHRDLPDPRDYTPEQTEVGDMLGGLNPLKHRPRSVTWREYFPPVEDQGECAADAAHACVALLQYFELCSSGRLIEPSRMFVYRTARRLLNWSGDCGASLRATWKAIVRFGAPPEKHWPYDAARLDAEPDPFAYAFAREFESIRYVRLDGRGKAGDEALETATSFLAAGFPFVLGFSVCTSLSREADIPFPTIYDRVRGGHAVVVVGYDDNHRCRSLKGALLIRNSWGPAWGDEGYGWLPYDYVRRYLAADIWTLVSPQWLASNEFQCPPPK